MTDPIILREGETISMAYKRHAREYLEAAGRAKEAAVMVPKAKRDPGTKFTTKAGKEHGKTLGWVLLKSEGYDFRSKKWHDIQLGMDLLFQTSSGLVAVQCAGIGERAAHWKRFVGLWGPQRATEWKWRIEYWEFTRGEPVPVKIEIWHDSNGTETRTP